VAPASAKSWQAWKTRDDALYSTYATASNFIFGRFLSFRLGFYDEPSRTKGVLPKMTFKPFKPLTIRKPDASLSEPPAKRRKTSGDDVEPQPQNRRISTPNLNIEKSDLREVDASVPSEKINVRADYSSVCYYSVLWRNVTAKKNKTWEGDGALIVDSESTTFYDASGKVLGRLQRSRPLLPGSTLSISSKELEVDGCISKDQFRDLVKNKDKRDKVKASSSPATAPSVRNNAITSHEPKLSLKQKLQLSKAEAVKAQFTRTEALIRNHQTQGQVRSKSLLSQLAGPPRDVNDTPIAKYNPSAPGALVFKRPKTVPLGRQIVDVVLDPVITQRLRPHQREGVKFLYECVMGLRDFGGQGCILADDMGLGKTLQTIALLWTLIKQSPIHQSPPVVKKALIVCPVSLIKNWKKEFKKWLRHTNIGVLQFEDPKTTRLSMFDGKVFNVMIIGYERLRTIADDLAEAHDIDIVICDEGHRLKTVKNKSAKAIEALNTPRRIILSGTPIQNDLSEFYAMANFINDGCLSSAKAFFKEYENPIMKSRQPNASPEDVQRGEAASEELVRVTSPFILRRTADILANFLPTKTEYVLFCKPTPQQATIYQNVIGSPMFRSAGGNTETALQLITILKKLCNSPVLMKPDSSSDATTSNSLKTLNEMLPGHTEKLYKNSTSSKIRLLDVLLQEIRMSTDEKVVLVSNYTSTLNLMEKLLESCGYRYLRLDGAVPSNKRQGLVDQFNRAKPSQTFAFLLSAKAGGVGIDLTGASRLILFDVDWNPATDDQAIARIHRQGQKRPTRIYRFLIKGGLEEKIWQRQVVKRGLADSIMENRNAETTPRTARSSKAKSGKATFTQEELKDLFRFDEAEGLRTHDLITCPCTGLPTHSSASTNTGTNTPKLNSEEEEEADKEASFWDPRSPHPDPESSDDDSLPDLSTIIRASQLSTTNPEDDSGTTSPIKRARKKQNQSETDAETEALMKYTHLDTSRVSSLGENDETLEMFSDALGDECLMRVLRKSQEEVSGAVSWVFKKMTGMQRLVEEGGGDVAGAVLGAT
jgi:DNA repair and recombination protein RAD54B